MKSFNACALVSILAFLSACGGGGGGGDTSDKSFLVSTSAGQGGNVNVASTTVTQSSTTSFSFSADTGYHVKSVTGCAGTLSGSNFTTGPINSACTVTAVFEKDTFIVDIMASDGGTYTLGSPTTNFGEVAHIVALPANGYSLDSFSGCGGTVSNETYTTAPVTSNCSVSILFRKTEGISGTAAEGAALTGGEVTAKCSNGSGFFKPVNVDASGHFKGYVDESVTPCALKIVLSNPDRSYYGIAIQAGTVNITPLTDLILSIASKKFGKDWFNSDDWEAVIPNLLSAQADVKSSLERLGYEFPNTDFEPLNAKFEIGDDWDKLLDQINAGITNSKDIKTYDGLVALVKDGDLENMPSSLGDNEITAEACFNQNLFAADTKLVMKQEFPSNLDGVSHTVKSTYVLSGQEVTNDSNGLLYITRTGQSTITDDIDPSASIRLDDSTIKFVINPEEKTVGISSVDGHEYSQSSSEGGTFYSVKYDHVGDQLRFKSLKGKTFSEQFVNTFELQQPSSSSISASTFKNTRFFKGITQIKRGNSFYNVCEFRLHREIITAATTEGEAPIVSNNDATQYFLVGSGVDVSDESIVSVELNGTELLNGQPN